MRLIITSLIAMLMFLPKISFADPKDEWVAFQKQQRAVEAAFLKAHPEVVLYLEEIHKAFIKKLPKNWSGARQQPSPSPQQFPATQN